MSKLNRNTCGKTLDDKDIFYTGEIPTFMLDTLTDEDRDFSCIIQETVKTVDDIVKTLDLTELEPDCFVFDPAKITNKQLHGLEKIKLCDHETRITDLETDIAVDIGLETLKVDLGCITPEYDECEQPTHIYTLETIVQHLVDKVCILKEEINTLCVGVDGTSGTSGIAGSSGSSGTSGTGTSGTNGSSGTSGGESYNMLRVINLHHFGGIVLNVIVNGFLVVQTPDVMPVFQDENKLFINGQLGVHMVEVFINTFPASGLLRVTDSLGNVQTIILSGTTDYQIFGVVCNDVSEVVVELLDSSEPSCNVYQIQATPTVSIEWEDCNGNLLFSTFSSGVTQSICARTGTVVQVSGSGVITDFGACSD